MTPRPIRTGATAPAGVLALTLVWVVAAGFARASAADVWQTVFAPADELTVEKARAEELGREQESSNTRLELNARVLDEVAAGRLSLADAVDQRMQINRGRAQLWEVLRARYPDAADDRDRMARFVLAWAESLGRTNPGVADDVLARLRTEFGVMSAEGY